MSFGKINPKTYTGDVFNNGAGQFMAMGANAFRNCSGGCGGYSNAGFADAVSRANTILANQGGVQQTNTGTTTTSESTDYAPPYTPEDEPKSNTLLWIGIGGAVLVAGFVIYKKFIKK